MNNQQNRPSPYRIEVQADANAIADMACALIDRFSDRCEIMRLIVEPFTYKGHVIRIEYRNNSRTIAEIYIPLEEDR